MKLLFSVILAICALKLVHSQNMCNKCQPNHIACVNQTSFYRCFDGVADKTNLFHCNIGKDCTNAAVMCLPSALNVPTCAAGLGCNKCSESVGQLFACTSENTYQMCFGKDTPFGPEAKCPGNKVCLADSTEICVAPCEGLFPTCYQFVHQEITTTTETTTEEPRTTTTEEPTTTTTTEEPTTTTTEEPTTTTEEPTTTTTEEPTTTTEEPTTTTTEEPTTTTTEEPTTTTTTEEPTTTTTETTTVTIPPITADDVCANKGTLGRFPMTDDTTCKRYASCLIKNGKVVGVEHSCPEGRYFDSNAQTCVTQRPAGCLLAA